MRLILGDCLEKMKDIPDGSIDLVLTDPPYGTTACKWDSVIPFEPMWEHVHRVAKKNAAICLFGSEPFSSALRMSNIKNFRYDWIWEKSRCQFFAQSKNRPLGSHEVVSVFSEGRCSDNSKILMSYHPQDLVKLDKPKHSIYKAHSLRPRRAPKHRKQVFTNFPKTNLKYKSEQNVVHPTQKPVALLEYLIKTYTLENETVLDFTMGSGSIGVAVKNLDRKFIGIEQDKKYFEIAKERING